MNRQFLYFSKLVSSNRYFFVPYLIFLLAGFVRLLLVPKGFDLLLLNKNHCTTLDYFFRIWTFLGDGLFVVFAVVPILIIRFRLALVTFVSFALSGIVAQVLKRIYDFPRPKAFFRDDTVLYFIEGVKVYSKHSFPSGHTATAFAFFLILSFASSNKRFGLLFFIMAFLVGMSRVYLLQHFFIDIYFGSIVGVTISSMLFIVSENWKYFRSLSWENKGLRDYYPNTFKFLNR